MLIYVTDHAILRYLERHHDIPVDHVRQKIKGLVARAAKMKAASVQTDGVIFTLNYNDDSVYVTTALPGGADRRKPASG